MYDQHDNVYLIPGTDTLLSKSILMVNGMDAVGLADSPGFPSWSTNNVPATPHSSLPATPHSIVATPPPEGPPPPYPYPTWCSPPVTSEIPTTVSMPTTMPSTNLGDYLSGSSIEYSPLSSPGSVNSCNLSAVHEPQLSDDLMYSQSSIAMGTTSHLCEMYYSDAVNAIPVTTGYQSGATTAYDTIMTTGYPPVTSYQPVATSPVTTIPDSTFGPKEVKMPQSK